MSREFMLLEERLTLDDGESLIDKDILVPETFAYDTALCAIYVSGHCVTIRNVRLYTYVDEYLDAWADHSAHAGTGIGIPWDMAGVRFAGGVKSPTLENVHVEGFPQSGITFGPLEDPTFRRVSVTRCSDGFYGGYESAATKRARFDGITAYNTWGPLMSLGSGDPEHESEIRPGYFIGGDGLSGYFDDFSFSRLHFYGEMFTGFKITRSKRGQVRQCHANQMFIAGTQGRFENIDLSTDGSENVTYRDCDVRKEYAVGMVSKPGNGANGIQVSWNVTGSRIVDTIINGEGGDGHGIQVTGDCEMDIRGCTIGDFNDFAGATPAVGIHVNDGSSVNADVLTVNDFTNQQRRILEAA